jgi:uncharacterized membrane protein
MEDSFYSGHHRRRHSCNRARVKNFLLAKMKRTTFIFLWRSFLAAALALNLVSQFDITSSEMSVWQNRSRDKSFHRAMAWLRENSGKNDIVLTPWQFGAQIPALTGRRVIASSKVYPSETKNVAERYSDLKTFFQEVKNENDALKITEKYNANFIFFQKGWRIKENTILEMMNDQKNLENFTPVYAAGRHIIYKIKTN